MIKMSLSFLIILFIVGCQKTGNEKSAGNVATTSIEVKTIKCEMCVDNITKALEKVDGVQKAEVDLKKKVATVQYVPSTVTLAFLENTIAQAGYDANSLKRNEDVYKDLPRCCQ
jgi:mercuric ion binding protein